MAKSMTLYLTDDQYKKVLSKIKLIVDDLNFKPYFYDSTDIGNKFNETNCGFCNKDLVTKDIALFPGDFPQVKVMRYRKHNQPCPFDKRIRGEESAGCFYYCMVFDKCSAGALRLAVNDTIKWAEENIE